MKLIGFVGKAQSGKTTSADYLVKTKKAVKLNFKDALVRELKTNFPQLLHSIGDQYGLTQEELFDKKPPSMRYLMQEYGTEVRRGDDKDYWTKQYLKQLHLFTGLERGHDGEGEPVELVVTDDVRFQNEAEVIRDAGGILIRIERSDIIDTGSHESEVEQDSIVVDRVIRVNKGEIEELYTALDDIK